MPALPPVSTMLLESIQMSVVVAHGEEEGEDGSHHEGHQLCLGEARLALSTMRVPVSHVCHLKIRKYQTMATGNKVEHTSEVFHLWEHMYSCHIEEGAGTEQHGSACARECVQVAL